MDGDGGEAADAGRSTPHPLRGRPHHLLPTSRGRRAGGRGAPEAVCEIRAGTARGEDTADHLRRFAEERLRRQGQGRPPTFDFLGFTHICARGRNGKFTVHVRTARKRMLRAMKRMAEWCRDHRHWSLPDQHRAISRALLGHYAYYGRSSNYPSLARFLGFTKRVWLKWLRRRSQRRRLSWAKYNNLLRWYSLPKPHVTQRAFASP